jgi:HAD superfamily hydrolase (TIGR01509 family)
MSLEAVIFDMDGVLVDSEIYWLKARQAFAAARGKQWTDADQRHAMGRNTIEWAHIMQQRLGLNDTLDAIMAEMKQRVIEQYNEHLPLRAGALDAVYEAAALYPVALASGSPTAIIQHVMALTGLDRVFRAVLYGDDFANGKPAPDIYYAACDALGADPARCAGVEDSANGIRAVVNAGMLCVGAPSPAFPLSPEVAALCSAQVASMTELTPAFWFELEVNHADRL